MSDERRAAYEQAIAAAEQRLERLRENGYAGGRAEADLRAHLTNLYARLDGGYLSAPVCECACSPLTERDEHEVRCLRCGRRARGSEKPHRGTREMAIWGIDTRAPR